MTTLLFLKPAAGICEAWAAGTHFMIAETGGKGGQ